MNKQTKELNRSNNELGKQIHAENKEALTDIVCYLRGANISEYHQEEIRQDLLEMILAAQERGENIQSVIGGDYKAFCDNIISSLPPKSMKEKTLEFLNILCWCLSLLGAINILLTQETISLIRNLATGKPLNFESSFTAGSIISIILIIAASIIIVNGFMKNSFTIGKKGNLSILKAFFIGAAIMALFELIAWLGKTTLFTMNIFYACAFVLALYVAHRILNETY